MGFKIGKRQGSIWKDALEIDEIIKNYPFHTTGKNEREFETGFSSTLIASKSRFKNKVISQIDKSTTVKSIYCFGKKHRPDVTFGEDGIAIEIKFVTYSVLREAIGQGYLYRLKYRFVFLILIMSEERKDVYENIVNENEEEKDLEDILTSLSKNMNIFTYIVPAFNITKAGMKKCLSFFNKVS